MVASEAVMAAATPVGIRAEVMVEDTAGIITESVLRLNAAIIRVS